MPQISLAKSFLSWFSGHRRKVVFLARTVPLVSQQYRNFKEYLPEYKVSNMHFISVSNIGSVLLGLPLLAACLTITGVIQRLIVLQSLGWNSHWLSHNHWGETATDCLTITGVKQLLIVSQSLGWNSYWLSYNHWSETATDCLTTTGVKQLKLPSWIDFEKLHGHIAPWDKRAGVEMNPKISLHYLSLHCVLAGRYMINVVLFCMFRLFHNKIQNTQEIIRMMFFN